MKYNVFISYRRNGGEYTAKILRDKLSELGYSVFFDIEALRSGDFNTKLYSVIDECEDFILVLSPGSLDRCENVDDWVRREIEYALEKGKNIVPIMLRGFKFPDVLPMSIEGVRFKNGIEANTEFFDAFIKKLQEFLVSRQKFGKRINVKKIIVPLLCVAVLIGGFFTGSLIFDGNNKEHEVESVSLYPATDKEKNLSREVVYYAQNHLTLMDIMAQAAMGSFDTALQYLSSNDRDFDVALNEFNMHWSSVNNVDCSSYAPTENLIGRVGESPFDLADFKAVHDLTVLFKDTCLDYIDRTAYTVSDEYYYSDNYKSEVISLYKQMLENELKAYAVGYNALLLPITDENELDELFREVLPYLMVMDLSVSNWQTDLKKLEIERDASWNRYNDAFNKYSALIGNAAAENSEIKRENDELKELIQAAEEAEKAGEELRKQTEMMENLRKQQEEMMREASETFELFE